MKNILYKLSKMARAVLFVTCVYFLSLALVPCLHAAPFGFDLFGGSICDLVDCCEDSDESDEEAENDVIKPPMDMEPKPPVVTTTAATIDASEPEE
ncbi:unnamed protein product [Ceutorhynchus assimilis]|uniref:Uncharacterized protein n=1 Tax=Ceutorhynchus assimilis TaxID=467358 RepID=A0A9N9QNK3_9CUCU|nr:unnamed protein product [Ceutorhynchus assimilis]